MQALYRTRSRHFVSSPRKAATPLKHRLLRHESKRRKLGANTALALDNTSSDSDTPRRPRGSKSRRDVFSTEESPKKRKREEDEGSETSGSWIEMEEEPEFIAESDQHLLEDAPLYALQRLRKAELVRLWKVAGMWPDEYTDEEISKKELVDGLIARRPSRDTLDEAEPTEPMVSFRTEVTPRAKHVLKTIRRKTRRRGRNIGRFEVKSLESQSSQSSFTTTDTSPPADPPRRTLRLGRRRVVESIEVVEESESENETPLVHRLRSRTRSSFKDSSDIEADGEDSEHERLPDRGAKRKAIEALKGGESDDAMDLTMDPVTEDTKDLADATQASLLRLLRDDLVQMCEARGIEVEGTKPQLAQALLDWRDRRSTSSQSTARPDSSTIIHAVASNVHESGKTTPVLLRDHVHAHDPATPARSDTDSKKTGEAELNLDLSELGLEDSMIKPSQLQKLEKIGSGGFKDVYIGKLRGRKVAISEFREHLSEMDIRELKLLAEFSHPNIVKFRGICIPEDNSQVPCMLVSELCENGDLFDYIRNVPCPPLKRVLELMLDIARGLEYLHTRKPAIIHRDCKSSNILINRAGQAKVGDFGLARVKHSTRSMIRSLVGTVNWQAPELWHPAPRYDYKVDVFSAAVVYWEMMSGWIGEKKYPWEGFNEHYIYDAVGQKQQRPSVDGLREYWGEEPVKLMERMWHQDPGERPTMTDVVVDLEVLVGEC